LKTNQNQGGEAMPATQSSTIDNLGDICIYRPELDGRAPNQP